MDKELAKDELLQAIEKSKSNVSFNELIEKLRDKAVIIYGAGYAGKFVYRILKDYSVHIQAFLDANAKEADELYGIPVYKPDCDRITARDKTNTVVIVCVLCETEEHFKQNLKSYGYQNVISYQEKALSFRCIGDNQPQILDYSFYASKKEDILKCTELWNDEISLRTYKNNLKAYILRSFNEFEKRVEHPQYFLPEIRFPKGYSRFIDCGAYDGDTTRDLVRLKGKVEAVVFFEPGLNIFQKLSDYIDDNCDSIADEIILYPCGVSAKTEILKFNSEAGASSTISDNGNTYIQCISIDEALKNFAPTFIKMDIEGAEYDALIGAKKTICKYKPDLAISVYHYADHIWDIPLLINSWNLGYKFYLRTYWTCGHETVMYAVSEE